MFQKEVAERISIGPGSKKYGLISVILQAYYDIEYLFTVGEQVFQPPPKVKSAVIRMKKTKAGKLNCNEALFKNVVKTAFNQRRKTLKNSLKVFLKNKPTNDPIFSERPEQLSVNQFVTLTNLLESMQ